jgi:hypothetical protein
MFVATEGLLYLRTVGLIRCVFKFDLVVATEGLLYLRTVGLIRCAFQFRNVCWY